MISKHRRTLVDKPHGYTEKKGTASVLVCTRELVTTLGGNTELLCTIHTGNTYWESSAFPVKTV